MSADPGPTGRHARERRSRPSRRHAVAALVGAAAVFVVWLLSGAPTTGPMWDLLLLVAPAVGIVVTYVIDQLLRRLVRPASRWQARWERRSRVQQSGILVVAVAAAAAVVAVIAVVVFKPGPGPCDGPDELRILTSRSQLAATEQLADAYELWTAAENDGCPTVRAHVYEVRTDLAIEALSTGWTTVDEVTPRPDVWFAESMADVEQVNEEIGGPDIEVVGLDGEVVASSPLVLAVAESTLAGVTGDDYRQGWTWTGLLGAADERGWQLVRTRPEVSRVGGLVVTALYGGGGDRTDLIDYAQRVERRIAAQAQAGYRPLADTDEFLSHYRTHGTADTALLVTEQAVVLSNLDESGNVACREMANRGTVPADGPSVGEGDAPDPLVALYPTDSLTVDYVAAALTWRHQSRQARAATGFRTWLGREGQVHLAEIGLRPPVPSLTDLATPLSTTACGAVPDALPPSQPSRQPPAGARERANGVYEAAQRPGRVLLAQDLSGSMAGEAPGGTATRHVVARKAVERAVQRLGEDDELGLWVFRGRNREQLVPIGPGSEPHKGMPRGEAVVAELADLEPDGETPLYRTIVDGVEAVGSHTDRVTALVVVTDGEDTSSGRADEERVAALDRTAGVPVFVVAVGEASCRIDTIARVTDQTDGDCIEADFGSLDEQLSDLFGVLWSGGQP